LIHATKVAITKIVGGLSAYTDKNILLLFLLPNTETKKYSMFSAGKIGKQKYNVVFLASKIPK